LIIHAPEALVMMFLKPSRGKTLIGSCATLAAIAISYLLLITLRPAHDQPGILAQERSRAAYTTFSSATSSFAASVRSCQAPTHPLPCLKAADNQLTDAFTQLARAINSIPVPSSAKYAAADLSDAAKQAAQSLLQLHGVSTLPQYRRTWATLSLPLDDIQVIHDYGYLQYMLSGESAGAGWSEDTATGTPARPDVSRITLEGDNYDHGAAIYSALQRLTQRCMSEQGFPYHRDIWEATPPQTDAPLYVDVTALRRDGYGIYGSYEKWTAVEAYATDLEAKVRTEALWSNVWISAQARWTRCLASGGFDYPTEAAAVYAVTTRYQASGARLSRVHHFELRIARQDAACTDGERLNQAGRAAIGAVAATLPRDQLGVLLTWQTMRARASAAAAKVLATP
jgi:hypothetical protein